MRSTGGSRAVIVGIFTILGIAIFALMILTLGSQRKTFTKSITIKSFFTNVNGLQKGNNIWYTGVKVGTIRNVEMQENGQVEVEMFIDESAKRFIHKDARAKLSSDGLIGNKIVEIYGGNTQSATIEDGDVLKTDTLFSTDQLMNTLSQNNDNLLGITANLKSITDQIAQGKGSIGKLLSDETLTDQINLLAKSLNHSAQNLEKITAAVNEFAGKLNQKGTLADNLVSDTTIFNTLKGITARLKTVTDSSQNFVNSLNVTGRTLKEGIQNPNSPIGMLTVDQQASKQIRQTLSNLQSASQKLDEDMEALQHNFLLRGYFKKKAKAEKLNPKVIVDTTFEN